MCLCSKIYNFLIKASHWHAVSTRYSQVLRLRPLKQRRRIVIFKRCPLTECMGSLCNLYLSAACVNDIGVRWMFFCMETDIHWGHKAGIPLHNIHKFGAEAGSVPGHRSGDLAFHNLFQVCGWFRFLFLKLKTKAALFSFLFFNFCRQCHYFISHSPDTCSIWLWTLKHQQNTFDNNRLGALYDLPISVKSCLH